MSWKVILTVGLILLSGAIFAQTNDSNTSKNQVLNETRYDSGDHWMMVCRRPYAADAGEVNKDLRAAELGDASAQFKMALRYDSGQGVLQNYTKAVTWLHKSAEQDFVKAQYNLGSMYYSGQGVPQDTAEAAKWYLQAAERGHASAQKNLGAMYGKGQGIHQSNTEAYIWSSIAAESGDAGATANRDFAGSLLSPEKLSVAQIRAVKLHEEILQRQARE